MAIAKRRLGFWTSELERFIGNLINMDCRRKFFVIPTELVSVACCLTATNSAADPSISPPSLSRWFTACQLPRKRIRSFISKRAPNGHGSHQAASHRDQLGGDEMQR